MGDAKPLREQIIRRLKSIPDDASIQITGTRDKLASSFRKRVRVEEVDFFTSAGRGVDARISEGHVKYVTKTLNENMYSPSDRTKILRGNELLHVLSELFERDSPQVLPLLYGTEGKGIKEVHYLEFCGDITLDQMLHPELTGDEQAVVQTLMSIKDGKPGAFNQGALESLLSKGIIRPPNGHVALTTAFRTIFDRFGPSGVPHDLRGKLLEKAMDLIYTFQEVATRAYHQPDSPLAAMDSFVQDESYLQSHFATTLEKISPKGDAGKKREALACFSNVFIPQFVAGIENCVVHGDAIPANVLVGDVDGLNLRLIDTGNVGYGNPYQDPDKLATYVRRYCGVDEDDILNMHEVAQSRFNLSGSDVPILTRIAGQIGVQGILDYRTDNAHRWNFSERSIQSLDHQRKISKSTLLDTLRSLRGKEVQLYSVDAVHMANFASVISDLVVNDYRS